ncbi:MAG: GntR family transcriptional regulator, partial [Pseudomonadota bacterium]
MTGDSETPAPIWIQIRDALTEEITAGRYPPGAQLPTEAALSLRFGVNRHTVRRALAALREDGLIRVRRGAGAFVLHGRIDYPLARRTRFRQNLALSGQSAGKTVLRVERRRADRQEAEALALAEGDPVVVFEAVGSADGLPISHGESTFSAAHPDLDRHLRETGSVTDALARAGR